MECIREFVIGGVIGCGSGAAAMSDGSSLTVVIIAVITCAAVFAVRMVRV